jgi:hypothetical protein
MKLNKTLALGAAGSALALTLAFGGMTAFAQTPTPTTPTTPSVSGESTPGFAGRGGGGWRHGGNSDEYLAAALDITVEELDAAQAEARAAMLADAVTAGTITQEQADLINARETVQSYLDKEALAASMEGLDREAAIAATQAAYEAAVAQAVADGAITQVQADALLAQPIGRGFGGGRGGRGGPGGRGAPNSGTTDDAAPAAPTTETSASGI